MEKKRKKNKTAGALWFVNVADVFGGATNRGEENKSEGGALGELPTVVGEKPKTSGGRLCIGEEGKNFPKGGGLPGGCFQQGRRKV